MSEETNYLVTEVGCFGSMTEFSENDPTCEQVSPNNKRKKKVSIDDLINESIEINKKNLTGLMP